MTKVSSRKLLPALLALVVGVGTLGVAKAQEETYEMSIQTAVPNSSIYFGLVERLGERIERMSNGQLEVRVLPDGAEVQAFEILDATSDGVVEAGYAWPHYWSGKNSAYLLFSNVPASTGMDQQTLMAWYHEGGGKELYQELNTEVMGYDTVAFLMQPMGPDPLGWFSQPFESLDEFSSLKYRAPPGIAGQTYNRMGIPAVAMPGGDIVPSAERGTIDAAEWIGPADDKALGLSEIWDNYYLQGLHQQTDVGELQINAEFWNSLPEHLRMIVETAILANTAETLHVNLHENSAAVRDYEAEGITVHDTPDEYFAEFIAAQNEIIGDYLEDDAFFAEVYESQADYAEMVYPYHSRIVALYNNVIEEAHAARNE